MKLRLNEEQLEQIKDIEFKAEGLGALEFVFGITDESFEKKDVKFRLERVSPQTYLKLSGNEKLEKVVPETFKNFIALPVEARNLDFFQYDTEALNILGSIINDFQGLPRLFRGGVEELTKHLSK